MRIACNKFDATGTIRPGRANSKPVACRFYAFPEGKDRVKVHHTGAVNYSSIIAEFKKLGVAVTEKELQAAYEA